MSNNTDKYENSIYRAFMQSPVAIGILKSSNYIIEFANDYYFTLLNKDNSIIGKSLFAVFPELKTQGLREFLDKVIENKVAQHKIEHEFIIVKNEVKENCFFNCDYQPLRETDGTITGLIVIFTEVTQQVLLKKKNNENQERMMEALNIANNELEKLTNEKRKRADELVIANEELYFQNTEKKNRADELLIANAELNYQKLEKKNRANELVIANEELDYQNTEKKNRADELVIANKELLFQIDEKEKRAAELIVANYARSLIEAALDPLITINTNGKITDTNRAMVEAVDMPRVQIMGSNFVEYFTDKKEAKKLFENVFLNATVVDFPLTLKDGKLIDVLYNGSVFKDGNGYVRGAVLVGRDVTQQKRTEKELTEAKVFAEDEKQKAEVATQLAENATKAKQQFLSNMSHEIRTPMNAIIGFTKVILKTTLTPKQKEYLTAIKMSGDALIVLINDILDLAKVDAGKMEFEKIPFKLALSVDAMLHLFETKIQEKNISLLVDFDKNIPKVLLGDPVRLHQIILNLISNAVKFTSQGSIIVSVKMLREDKQKATIEFNIADTGIGISAEKIDKIFENFQQATSGTSRLYGGTGLGLAIVKQLVNLQGGDIVVKSKINEGATFSFILNFEKTDTKEILETEIMELDDDVKEIKILVVEDMPLNQLLMKTLLDDFGFESDITSNGKLALEKLATKPYDIILMDLQMPEMNGFETTDYIRNTLKSNIPIVALTADVTTVDVARCKEIGMNDYIAKPVDERLLYSKILGLVKKPVVIVSKELLIEAIEEQKIIKCINLDYLTTRTKSNPELMIQMMQIYLDQTPPLVSIMKKSFAEKDWDNLDAAVHKMIPSFTIIGISKEYEVMAKKIQQYAVAKKEEADIEQLITQLENILHQSFSELEIELNQLKNSK